jgi:signal transduction histidine kinase
VRLSYRLPLIVSALFATLFVIGTWLAYREVRHATSVAAAERVRGAADRLAAVVQTALAQRHSLMERVAADPRVARAAAAGASPDLDALAAAVAPLGADTTALVVLLRADGSAVRLGRAFADVPAPSAEALLGMAGPEGVRHSRMQTRGGLSFFWMAVPVAAVDGRWALLAQLRPLVGNAAVIADLIGDQAAIYFANADGGDWYELGERPLPAPAPHHVDGDRLRHTRAGRDFDAFVRPLAGTPWHLIVELPTDVAHERAGLFLRRIVAVGALLSLLGIVATVLATRRMLRPIGALSAATGAIASGTYGRRVDVDGDDEVAQLADSFNAMAARIEIAVGEAKHGQLRADEANRAKSAFLAAMSHEIRTPINAVIGYAELLELGMGGEPSTEQRIFIERIKLSGRHLTRLVDEILDVARIEAGRLRVNAGVCHAPEHVQAAVAFVTPQARLRRIAIEVTTTPVELFADPQRVEQILVNLLSNAVKFTDEGGVVRASCRVKQAPPVLGGGRMCCFEVSDDGCGVPADMFESIFEPFVQAESGYTRSRGGAGLGLSISRDLAGMMGGAITLSSQVGVGSSFRLWLPLAAVPAPDLVPAGD